MMRARSRFVGATRCVRRGGRGDDRGVRRSGRGRVCAAWLRPMAGDHTGSPLRNGRRGCWGSAGEGEVGMVASRDDRMDGKVVLVTGAGSRADGIGNGRAASILLA